MTAFIETELITIRGDEMTLDLLVARRFRAYLPGYVERVLDLNPGLAAKGPVLPVGTVVALPPPTREETTTEIVVIKLWN